MKGVMHYIAEDMGCAHPWCSCDAMAWIPERVSTGLWMAGEYLAAISKLNEPLNEPQ